MLNKLKQKALNHIVEMNKKYHNEINYSIEKSVIFDDLFHVGREKFDRTEISVVDMDSTSAAFNYKDETKRCALLNFASCVNPGGGFTVGATAQEEMLCHESTLYNVISKFTSYYLWNINNLNRYLFKNKAIYSSDIIFERGGNTVKFDVITCAAPDFSSFTLYCDDFALNENAIDDNDRVMKDRVRYVLSVAASCDVDVLILGAFGCGAFMQDPNKVANYFREYLENDFKNQFEKVIFAIPSSNKKNYSTFKEIIGKEICDEEHNVLSKCV